MNSTIDPPVSPVTGNPCVDIVDTFAVSDIARLYLRQEKTDVSEYLGHGDTVFLMECAETGYRFYFPFEMAGDEAFYQKLADERSKSGGDYDRDWSPDHQFAFDSIERGEKILEIGCNTGKFLERVKEKTPDVSGLEFNPVAVAAAEKKGLDVRNLDIARLAETDPESYDVVCAFHVLEHITGVKPFIENCLKVLKPKGKLIFAVPNNEPFFQRFSKYEVLNLPPHHMGLWNLAAFRKLGDFFEIDLAEFEFSGSSSFPADVYLRARAMAGIKNLPADANLAEKVTAILFSPFAAVMSGVDWLGGKKNNAHVSVIFVKNERKIR